MLTFMKRLTPVGLALGLLATPAAFGQETDQDLAAQIEELRKGQEQIRKQLQQIQTLLQQQRQAAPQRPAGPDVAGKVFDLGDNPVKGADSARLTLVEFTDYQ